MRVFSPQKNGNNDNSRIGSLSSLSSSDSASSMLKNTESQPVASTSTGKHIRIDTTDFKEVNDPSAVTHSEHINPMRDELLD